MHPDELDLMEFVDGTARPDVTEHVEACEACRWAVAQFADVGEPPSGADVEARVGARVSPSVLAALDHTPPNSIKAGQLWRARWDDDTQLACVLAVESSSCRLAPASLDVHLAGPGVRIVDASESPLGYPLGIWTTRAVDTRCSLLEQYLGHLGAELGDEEAGASAYELAALDDRTLFAERLGERLLQLTAHAAWEPEQRGERLSLSKTLTRAGISMSDLATLLDVDIPTALDLWRDDADPSSAQLAILDQAARDRGATDLPSSAASAVLPAELLDELTRPVWKPRVLADRGARSTTEAEARLAAATAAFGLTLAARSRRDTATDWAEALDRVLP